MTKNDQEPEIKRVMLVNELTFIKFHYTILFCAILQIYAPRHEFKPFGELEGPPLHEIKPKKGVPVKANYDKRFGLPAFTPLKVKKRTLFQK